jgi:hypothetical protein
MKKNLEVVLGIVPYAKNCPALRVTHLVYINEKKDDKFWEEKIGVCFGRMNENYQFEMTANKIELEYKDAESLINLFKKTNYTHNDPRYTFCWPDLVEIPEWLYFDEENRGWWHEEPPMGTPGKWLKYKDYIAKRSDDEQLAPDTQKS